MNNFTPEQKNTLDERVNNLSIDRDERAEIYRSLIDEIMNPVKKFDPSTFDIMNDVEGYDVKKRERTMPKDRLETFGMYPKKILIGQMIGMYESKQDLYLTMAYYINNILDKIDTLETEINTLKNK